MSGFMRQLKQNNNSQFKKYKYKQAIKTNQGSVVSLQSTLVKNIQQSCCAGKETTYQNRNMSNKNLVNQRILTKGKNETCKKNPEKQYSSNSDFIDQLKSNNINYCNQSCDNSCNSRTNSVKNMNTLNNSDYITLYRSSVVAQPVVAPPGGVDCISIVGKWVSSKNLPVVVFVQYGCSVKSSDGKVYKVLGDTVTLNNDHRVFGVISNHGQTIHWNNGDTFFRRYPKARYIKITFPAGNVILIYRAFG